MADFLVSGRMKVKSLKASFKENFGATLRVYNGKRFADDDVSLATIRSEKAQVTRSEFKISGNMQIGTFRKKFKEELGISVHVADKNDEKLLDESLTLSAASKLK